MKIFKKNRIHTICSQLLVAMFASSIVSASAFAAQADEVKTSDEDQSPKEKLAKKKKQEDDIEVIEITGSRDALAAAIARKRESKNISDSIIAEDIGKMPDENIAEAMQRITGISIERSMGEGSTVNVRGMSGEFNMVKVNGQTLTSGGDGRNIDFSSMSADLLSAIEVVKTPSASHDEGSIGASINLKTRRPLDSKKEQVFSANIKESYNELTEEFDPSLAFTYIRNVDNVLGFTGSVSYETRHVRQDQYFTRGWRPFDLDTLTDAHFSADSAEESKANVAGVPYVGMNEDNPTGTRIGYYPDEFGQRVDLQERERFGATMTFQYRPTDDIDTYVDLTYSQLENTKTMYQNWNRFRYNAFTDDGSGNQVVGVENIVIDPNGTMLHGEFSGHGPKYAQQQTTSRGERRGDTKTQSFAIGIGGEYRMENLTISTELGYSGSREKNDNENQYLFTANNVTHGFNVGDDNLIEIFDAGDAYVPRWDNPHNLSQIRENARDITDDNFSAQIDFDYAIDSELFPSVKFGLKWTDRVKGKEDDSTYIKMWLEDIEQTDKIRSSFMDSENPTPFPVDDFMNGYGSSNMHRDWSVIDFDTAEQNALNVFGVDSFDELPFSKYRDYRNSFALDIETRAAYAMIDIDALDGALVGDFGVRYVKTIRTSKGYAGTQYNMLEYRPGLDNYAKLPVVDYRDVEVVKEYDNVLPSLNLRYALNEEMLVRFATAKVMARPNFWEIAPYLKSSPLIEPAKMWAGNPDLDAFEANQVDLSYEWYFDKGAMFSVGLFYKDITSFYYNSITPGVTHDSTGAPLWLDGEGEPVDFIAHQPQNGEAGTILGLETQFQTNFTFLPGIWSNFGTLLNYTYSDSEASYLKLEADNDSPLQDIDLPFLNQSKHSGNAALYYEGKGLNVRLAYTYRTESIYQPSGNNGNIYWNDSYGQLDFSSGISIGKYWVSFQVRNMTNEVQKRYATSPYDGNSLEGEGPTNRMLYMAQTGRTYSLGINGKF